MGIYYCDGCDSYHDSKNGVDYKTDDTGTHYCEDSETDSSKVKDV